MNTNYTIKNFRVFDEDGVSVSLKPLTLLTGCNSSGKSSLVKSLMLIYDYFSEIKMDHENGKRINLTVHKLDFTKVPHNSLGKFAKVVNNKSENDTITFGIQTHSLMLGQDVVLGVTFAPGTSDSTNGYIKSISVKKMDGTVIYQSDTENGSMGNLYEVFDEYVRFTYTQHAITHYESISAARCIDYEISDEDYKKLVDNLKAYLNEFKKQYGRRVLKDIVRWNNNQTRQTFIGKTKEFPHDIIEEVKKFNMLHYVPFIGEKLTGNKEEVCNVLCECINEGIIDKATCVILTKVVEDFKTSEFYSFVEYYKHLEKECLTGYKLNSRFGLEKMELPNLPSSHNNSIRANVITMSPYNVTTVGSFSLDDDGFKYAEDESEEVKAQRETAKLAEIAEWEARPLSFEGVFEAMCILSETYCGKEQPFSSAPSPMGAFDYSSHAAYEFMKFVEEAIKEVVVNVVPDSLEYVSSSVINVKRLYPLESNDEFTQILKRYIEAKQNLPKELEYEPNTYFNKWIRAFGVGEKVFVNIDAEGLGVTLRLHKDANDKEGTLLADNGYGITQLFAILLNIEVAIMERSVCNKVRDEFIGGFHGQEDIVKVTSSPTIIIEEPEIHLHPSYQSLLADMLYEAYQNYGIHFIVETHSEYLIRKSQLLVSKMGYQTNDEAEEKCPFITYYVPRNGLPYSLGYRKDGKFRESFGSGFYDEASNLAFEIL